jgi:hypothetical protein
MLQPHRQPSNIAAAVTRAANENTNKNANIRPSLRNCISFIVPYAAIGLLDLGLFFEFDEVPRWPMLKASAMMPAATVRICACCSIACCARSITPEALRAAIEKVLA